jgi:hypothetical protein
MRSTALGAWGDYDRDDPYPLFALARPTIKEERALTQALEHGARRDVIVVAAAGNQATLASTAITRHPWVIPVVCYDDHARPQDHSTIGRSIGRSGLGAPGVEITSLGAGWKAGNGQRHQRGRTVCHRRRRAALRGIP